MTKRIYNFAAGPCTLPLETLEEAQREFVDYQGAGMSLIEMSHRGKQYDAVHNEALALLRELLAVPSDFEILLLGGGATLQFAMVPMNLCKDGKKAAYVVAGAWGKKACADGKKLGHGYAAWDGKENNYTRVPKDNEIKLQPDTAFLHVTTNETIGGIRHTALPNLPVPIVADMSSEFMSRPVKWDKLTLAYAGVQKNVGPAGLAIVIAKKDVLEAAPDTMGAYLRYATHIEDKSMYNTPPVFQIYMMGKVLKWMKQNGGLVGMEEKAEARAKIIYDAIDNSGGYYRTPVAKEDRSRMNIVFRLPTEALEEKFIAESQKNSMSGLKGHRSVGGCRASVYNAMPLAGAQALADLMASFKKQNPA
jgi:phosphoserine aminotransferase